MRFEQAISEFDPVLGLEVRGTEHRDQDVLRVLDHVRRRPQHTGCARCAWHRPARYRW